MCGLSSDLVFWRFFCLFWKTLDFCFFSSTGFSVLWVLEVYWQFPKIATTTADWNVFSTDPHLSAYKFSESGLADCTLGKAFPHGVLLIHSKYMFRNCGILCFPVLSLSYHYGIAPLPVDLMRSVLRQNLLKFCNTLKTLQSCVLVIVLETGQMSNTTKKHPGTQKRPWRANIPARQSCQGVSHSVAAGN